MDNEASCRKRAREAAEIADRMTNGEDKSAWLVVAKEWLKLADAAKTRTKKAESE